MNSNIEIKAPVPDLGRVLSLGLAFGASHGGVLLQRDTYFDVGSGRLKLREELTSGSAELIFYERPADDGIRESRYVRARVEGDETRHLFELALGVVGTVTKKRRLLLWQGVRIHLDEVEGLGSFVELEAVVSDQLDPRQAREHVDTLLEALAINVADLEPAGYLELLLAAEPE